MPDERRMVTRMGKKEKAGKREGMPKEKKKKIIKRSIAGGAAGVLVLLIVASSISSANSKPVVITAEVVRGDIEQTISTSGSVASEEVKTYFAPISVEVGAIHAAAGENIAKGEPVITYDQEALEQEKRRAELQLQANEGGYQNTVGKNKESLGDLQEANTNLGVLEQQITDIDNCIKELQKKVDDKKAALAHEGTLLQISLIDWADQPDSDEYQNLQKLVQQNHYEQSNNAEIRAWQEEISRYTEMLNNCKEYRAEMKSQKASAEGAKMSQGSQEELEAKREMEGMANQRVLEAVEESRGGVLAAFSGVVTEMNVTEGQIPAQGTQMFKLESTEKVKVTIAVTKYDLEKLEAGQQAVVTIAGSTYEGEVSKIDRMAVKNSSGAPVVNADIRILNPDENIFLGVEAKVTIRTAKSEQALLVPISAVNTDKDGDFVYAVENGIVVRKPVQTGISSDMNMEIREGLAPADQVLTEVSSDIQEGMKVTAVLEESGAQTVTESMDETKESAAGAEPEE